jgi:serine/threonine protein kinase
MYDEGILKISDFGWSVRSEKESRKTFCGTLEYLPPEMVGKYNYDNMIDIWCVGILTYELAVGRTPFISTYDS